MTTDNDLMNSVRDGEIARLGILFERYKKKLYNFFRISTGDSHASEDLVQDVFVRVLQYRHTYRDREDFSVWLYSVARNVRIDHYRKNGTRPVSLEDSPDIQSGDPAPDEAYERSAETELLGRALLGLDGDARELIVLSRYNNLRYREIGCILGITEGAVKVRMYRALKDLAEIYHDLESGKKHGL